MNTSDIRSSFDTLNSNIESFISWANGIEQKEKLTAELDFKLRDREKILNKKVDEVMLRENKIKSDSLVLDSKMNELEGIKLEIKSIDNKIEQLKKEEFIIKEKQNNLNGREAKIKQREKELEILKDTEKELDHRESLLKKAMLMDKNRQEALDLREVELNKEKQRIQKLADSLQNIKP